MAIRNQASVLRNQAKLWSTKFGRVPASGQPALQCGVGAGPRTTVYSSISFSLQVLCPPILGTYRNSNKAAKEPPQLIDMAPLRQSDVENQLRSQECSPPTIPQTARLSERIQSQPSDPCPGSYRSGGDSVGISTLTTGTENENDEINAIRRRNGDTQEDTEPSEPIDETYKEPWAPFDKYSPQALAKERLLDVLSPLMAQDSSALLLCTGEEDWCRIIPVRIRDSADTIAQWSEAQRVWRLHKTRWRSWIPLYGVISVSVVQVCYRSFAVKVGDYSRLIQVHIGAHSR